MSDPLSLSGVETEMLFQERFVKHSDLCKSSLLSPVVQLVTELHRGNKVPLEGRLEYKYSKISFWRPSFSGRLPWRPNLFIIHHRAIKFN